MSDLTLTSGATEPLTTEPQATFSAAKYPVLTVSAISNYFGRIDADYSEYTREVKVTYMMKCSRRLLSVDCTLNYDTSLLTVDPEKNTVDSVFSVLKKDAIMSIDAEKGVIHFSASDMSMFDFSTAESMFAQIIFDVPLLSPEDSEITKIDLSVNDLIAAEPDAQTGKSMSGTEIVLVANGKILKNNDTKKVQISKYTTITPSTFAEAPTKHASADQIVTTVPPTTLATTAPTQPTTAPKPRPAENKEDSTALLYTGTWTIALLILLILLTCSTVLFVMRKRDIYNE